MIVLWNILIRDDLRFQLQILHLYLSCWADVVAFDEQITFLVAVENKIVTLVDEKFDRKGYIDTVVRGSVIFSFDRNPNCVVRKKPANGETCRAATSRKLTR